jgi:hypothetical protein
LQCFLTTTNNSLKTESNELKVELATTDSLLGVSAFALSMAKSIDTAYDAGIRDRHLNY